LLPDTGFFWQISHIHATVVLLLNEMNLVKIG